ncbi:fibronectin type III domain-containing protein [Pararcticibacter amylolyticus]|uniref:Fibronectin type III domain-containing protein n=1 Tax=Pararcticibacter amylolyticus TaxID=2173175 RepID=A0A2U2PAG7_9SPHI|nr:fibronectin type III domain-containing protein [Pararcticibacter amylolyticus]PWG78294.1 fibronectin type III domain-containing protein [Pararcticibacter amylolyticus]
MKKILIYVWFIAGLTAFSSCSDDVMDEITSVNLSRTLSPTDLGVIVYNKTGARLTWKAVNNAKSYTLEIFENADFSGSPVKKVDNISFDQVPYTVTALGGETKYFVRVKAVGEGIDDSKWITATFTTDAEQIFQDVSPENLAAKSVKLNWPAGEIATSIVLTPGNINHTVTSEEITAGAATISGLTPETTYTAKLMNGTKTRGTKTFTTLIDLDGAIAVYPTDNFASIIANAAGGETFALMPGEYTINADIAISKSISIKGARPSDKPVIKGMAVKLRGNAGLSLKDLVLDGTGALNSNQAIIYDEALDNAYAALNVENCEIKNYIKGVMYVNVKALIEAVTFRGNIIHHIECNGGDFIDFRTGLAKTFLFENNTVYASAAERDLFRMDNAGSTNFPSINSVITIQTNTFNSVSTGSSRRFLYIRLATHQIYFTKNIITNTNGYYTNQASTTITTMADNNYFNALNFTASATANAKNDTGVYTTLDPQFTNASQGNFTINNLDLKAKGVGDPRWRQ